MRILILDQYFPPDRTNTAVLLGQLAEDLVALGHEVWFVAGQPSYDPEPGARAPAGVRVIRTRSTAFSRVGTFARAANYLSYFTGVVLRSGRLPRPDVVVAATDPPFIGVAAAIVARRRRAPLVQILYDVYPEVAVALRRLRLPGLAAAWRLVNRSVRARTHLIVAIGRDMRENLIAQGVPASRIEVVPNWAEPNPATEGEVRAIRQELGLLDRFVVLHAGNVGLGHNLGALVRAADRVRDLPDVSFVIMGEGAAKPALLAEVRRRGLPNVRFLPYQDRERALRIVAAADLHAVSLAPGLTGWIVPSKVYGIMAAGRPFIAAVEARSEIGRLIAEHGCGVRVEPDDDRAIAAAVRRLRGDDLAAMGARGLAAFDASFRRERSTGRYAELLAGVVGTS